MDAIQESLNQMMVTFTKRLDTIEGQIQKPSSSSPSPGNLAEEFTSFKAFVLISMRALQGQISLLANQADTVEMRGRRKILLLHGLPEGQKEDTSTVVVKAVVERLKLDSFNPADISRCHRMGRSAGNDRPRPILFKLRDVAVRDKIWSSKTNLKGSGITVSEFLTKTRHDVFLAARQRFGVTKCWSNQGNIFVLASDGTRHRVSSIGDLDEITAKETAKPSVAVSAKEAAVVKEAVAGPSKTRRGVASKK